MPQEIHVFSNVESQVFTGDRTQNNGVPSGCANHYTNAPLLVHYCTSAIDDFRGACAVKGNVQVAGRTSSVSTTEMLSTHDVTLRNVDGSLCYVQI